VPDHPRAVDHEGRAADTEFLVAIDLLGLPDAIPFADRTFGIGEQFDSDAFLVAKLCVLQAVVPADADQDAIMAEKIVLVIRKIGHFLGATRGAILRVEEEHDVFTLEAGQIDSLHVGIRQ